MADKKAKGTLTELEEMCIILRIPKGTTKLKVTATIQDEKGNEIKAKRVFSIDDILQMRQDFLDNVEFGDGFDEQLFITEDGLEYLESLKDLEHRR